MKKKYLVPSTSAVLLDLPSFICVSDSITSDRGLDYGGVDTEGDKDPSARKSYDLWGEQEEDDQ